MRNLSLVELEKLGQELEGNTSLVEKNFDYNVPSLLNTNLTYLHYKWNDLYERKSNGSSFFDEFRTIENMRGHNFSEAFEHLTEKYYQANKTNKLLNKTKSPFILYLHGFTTKNVQYQSGSIDLISGGSDQHELINLSKKIIDIPIVYISNPIDSDVLNFKTMYDGGKYENMYRVECGKNWLEIVEILILKSNIVFIEFDKISKSIENEVNLLRKVSKLKNIFIKTTNENLNKLKINKKFNRVKENYQQIIDSFNFTCKMNTGNIPISCLWVDGDLRKDAIKDHENYYHQLHTRIAENKPVSGVALLDYWTSTIAFSISMENMDILLFAIKNKISMLLEYPRKLKNKNKLILSYLFYQVRLENAFSKTNFENDRIKNNIQIFYKINSQRKLYINIKLVLILIFKYIRLQLHSKIISIFMK